jgi:uncharacterized protein (TIGR02996 family)
MRDDRAFIEALVENPADTTTRLVYADWLEEQGDPRGEYLRLLVAIDADAITTTAHPMRERLRQLTGQFDRVWVRHMNRGRLRTHGLYQDVSAGYGNRYIRFYAEGIVLTVPSTGTPEQVWRWLKAENADPNLMRGEVLVSGPDVAFSATSRHGTIDFTGSVHGGIISVDVHSHMNGLKRIEVYHFVALEPEPTGRTPTGDPVSPP